MSDPSTDYKKKMTKKSSVWPTAVEPEKPKKKGKPTIIVPLPKTVEPLEKIKD
jgi:hypothetical protein